MDFPLFGYSEQTLIPLGALNNRESTVTNTHFFYKQPDC